MSQKEQLSSLTGSRVELIFTTGGKITGTIEATDEYENILLTNVIFDGERFDRVLLSTTKIVRHRVL